MQHPIEYFPLRGALAVAAPASLELITPYVLMEQHDWFEDEIRFVRRLVTPGSWAVDVGASYGVYALTLARLAGPAGRVIAVEPASVTLTCLRQSVAHNGLTNLTVVPAALADQPGAGRLILGAQAELHRLADGAQVETAYETVEQRTLDQLAGLGGAGPTLLRLDFLKLDVEGAEARVLEGGARTLAQHSPLVMFELRHGAELDVGLWERFAEQGYASYRLIPGLGLLVPVPRPAEQAVDPFLLNLFACKPDRAEALERAGLLCREVPATAALAPVDPQLAAMWLDRFPYARQLATALAREPGPAVPEAARYELGLACYARAHLLPAMPGKRQRALLDSLLFLEEAAAVHGSPARLQSLARVAWELGLRQRAVEVLGRLVEQLGAGVDLRLDEPFLSPSPRLDRVDPRGRLGDFCLLGVLEQREKLRAFSSYYTGQSGLSAMLLMQRVATGGPTGLLDEEIDRRVALIQRRHNLPTA